MGTSNRVETLILRFRDGLVSKQTIEEHKSIINSKGYVWWGWWAKPQETVPAATFSSICVKIKNKHSLDIYLFDSGTLTLFKATCTKLEYQNDITNRLSPEIDHTPAYYQENEYFAWFKLTSIESCKISILKKYSYVDIDEFFSSGFSPFKIFDNKVVFGAKELHEQQRTIWFIRQKQEGDNTQEIKLFTQTKNVVGNVDQTFKVLSAKQILWFSDLHFSKEHHAFINTETENNSLSHRLNEILLKEKISPSSVIISGDLTFKALEDEFILAEEFIRYINSAYSLDNSVYTIVPGNHDLAFSNTPDKHEAEITKTYIEAKENFLKFYNKIFDCYPTEELYSIKRFLTPDLVPVEIIGINSCYLQQRKDAFQGLGYVGSNQMDKIRAELALTAQASPLRILVMHHHLMPVIYKETPEYKKTYSLTLDAEAIIQLICDCNIKVVLHGHNHKEFYAEIIRKIKDKKKKFYIVGLGSSGVKESELSDGRTNMFATITIDKTKLVINGFTISPNGEAHNNLFQHDIPIIEEV